MDINGEKNRQVENTGITIAPRRKLSRYLGVVLCTLRRPRRASFVGGGLE
jgi:hypothetical protein